MQKLSISFAFALLCLYPWTYILSPVFMQVPTTVAPQNLPHVPVSGLRHLRERESHQSPLQPCAWKVFLSIPVLQLAYLSLSASNTTKPLLSLAGGGEEKVAWSNFELCSQEAFLLQMIKSTSYLRWIHLILPIHQVGSNVLNPRQKHITLLTSSCTSFKTLTYGQEDFPVRICVPLRSSKSTRAKLAAV